MRAAWQDGRKQQPPGHAGEAKENGAGHAGLALWARSRERGLGLCLRKRQERLQGGDGEENENREYVAGDAFTLLLRSFGRPRPPRPPAAPAAFLGSGLEMRGYLVPRCRRFERGAGRCHPPHRLGAKERFHHRFVATRATHTKKVQMSTRAPLLNATRGLHLCCRRLHLYLAVAYVIAPCHSPCHVVCVWA